METKTLAFSILFIISALLGIGINNVFAQEIVYNLEGDRQLHLPDGYLPKDMKGVVLVSLIIGDKSNLLNFAIIRVSLYDADSSNSINYFKKDFTEDLYSANSKIFTKEYYPYYVRDLYGFIEKKVKEWKIELVDKRYLEKKNRVGVAIKI